VIGGLLRDLSFVGNSGFKSDVDFVVDPVSMTEFDRLALQRGARLNRFGGFGITLHRWKVDVWPLERTLAAVHGYAKVKSLQDLVHTTFFDCDAVLYDVMAHKVTAKRGFFKRIQSRVIDINLEPNPNPLGNAVRALRYAYRWDAAFGEKLVMHVAKQIHDHGWKALVASECRSFTTPVLVSMNGDAVTSALEDSAERGTGPIRLDLRPIQEELPFAVDEPGVAA
jgi:hypothetical protein